MTRGFPRRSGGNLFGELVHTVEVCSPDQITACLAQARPARRFPKMECHLIDDTLFLPRYPSVAMNVPVHPRIRQLDPLVDALFAAAAFTAKAARKKYRELKRRRGYAALRPGPDTPLWNELARACELHLTRYGDKAKLARLLGVPRQRIHLLLVSKNACPDAERTLQLLAWLQARRKGIDPA